MSKRLRVDVAILDYNYVRMLDCASRYTEERWRRFQERHRDNKLHISDFAVALEFYLQIDGRSLSLLCWWRYSLIVSCIVDMFYMKTCSFRDAQPRSVDEGLFCRSEPEARYAMTDCGNCGLCCPKYDVKRREGPPVVQFGPAQRHQFVNKYEAILNCPAVSFTSCRIERTSVLVVLVVYHTEYHLCVDLPMWQSRLHWWDWLFTERSFIM